MLENLLTSAGFDVALAKDGSEALALMEQRNVDLMLLDLMMPGLSGLEVLKTARGRGFDLPIVVVTARGSAKDTATALEQGADDYVAKPFSPLVLLARLKLRLRPRERAAELRASPPPPPIDSDGVLLSSGDVQPVDEPAPVPASPPSAASAATPPSAAVEPGLMAAVLRKLKRTATRTEAASLLPPLVEGTLLADRYRVGKVLGRGSFGVVHQARHVELEMDVALKVLQGDAQEMVDGVTAYERFHREAMRACRVRHEHAVRVLDFGVTVEKRPYLVMELLEGPTLEARLKEGPLEPTQVATTAAGVLEALGAAHREGIVHQDVKASNVILAQTPEAGTTPKLIDFGAAAELRDLPSEHILGTASHMAPERFATGACDAKGDVYAAGVVLYRSLTGRLPFVHEDVEELARLHATATPERPTALRPGLERRWDEVVFRLLEKNAERRPTAQQAAALVRRLASHSAPG